MSTVDPTQLLAPERPAPRAVRAPASRADRWFDRATSAAGLAVFALLLLIGLFLVLRAWGTFGGQGWAFFQRVEWRRDTEPPRLGVLGLLAGTLIVASIAIVIAVPVAVLTSLYITGFAPPRLQRTFGTFVDLLAAVPSLLYGIWGFGVLGTQIEPLARWLTRNLSWFPPFRTEADAALTGSFFGAGIVVALMAVPIIASITREVFAQAPPGEREAALALGGTQWAMLRQVVIPFGRGGIVGGAMLGLGRALGETIAVTLMLPGVPVLSIRILQNGGATISGFIAQRAGSDPITVSGLMAAGLVLFVLTLATNLVASLVIARSRSGAGVEL